MLLGTVEILELCPLPQTGCCALRQGGGGGRGGLGVVGGVGG